MAANCVDVNMYTILDFARFPIAVMTGAEKIFRYVNPAFCNLVVKNAEEMVGRPFATLIPDEECVLLLDRVYRSGECETHAEEAQTKHILSGTSYEIWPTGCETSDRGDPSGVVLQITEARPLNNRTAVMTEALLLSAVRQHELMEDAESLNTKLTAEIVKRQRVELETEQLAYYDSLTDLPNRRLLMDRLHHATVACARSLHHGAILFIDLDNFKRLNDSRGHHVGDLLLQQIAHRLKECVRGDDTVARLGGDEFVVMIKDLSEDSATANGQAKKIAVKILASLDQPYFLADHQHRCGASIGIALFGNNRESVDEVLRRADFAQYKAKRAGGSSVRFFDLEMEAKATVRAALESDLRQAVEKKQLRLHYQPQVDDEGYLLGVEALLRWEHPDRGLLLPSEFIAFAEEHGIIDSMGQWVTETVCSQLKDWGLKSETSQLTIAMNVSAREFGHPAFLTRMLKTLNTAGADPKKLVLELTERVMFGPIDETLVRMNTLKNHGVSFALDDFGIGFSSLASVKNLPLSQLKIDRSFVSDVFINPVDAVIVSAIIDLGRNLGLSVIAEGVETQEQRQFLAKQGCRIYQGYLFGRPGPIEDLVFNTRTRDSISGTPQVGDDESNYHHV